MKFKSKIIIIVLIIAFVLLTTVSYADGKVYLSSNNENLKIGNEIEISVNIDNLALLAFQIELIFDNNKLEYVSGPENVNVIDNRILYVWYDETGKDNPKITGNIGKFIFKIKGDGNTRISINGEFFNTNLQKEIVDLKDIELNIENEMFVMSIEKEENSVENLVSPENVNLKVLRLNKEGIVPEFDPSVTEYYITVDDTIKKLKVTAIPENLEATVTITGNENLVLGKNLIKINVKSNDKIKEKNYLINVIKTSNVEAANTSLLTLAIENTMLYPTFSVDEVNYFVTVPNEIENLNILAIPENLNALVNIEGNKNLKIGDNSVVITVTGSDRNFY